MTPGDTLKYAIGLRPEKAVEFFKSKGYAFSWDWHDTRKEAHAKAFTVTKAMRMDILQDIRGEVERAIEEGATFEEFKKNLTPLLQQKGWWGRRLLGDGGGGATEVQLGSPRRLKTIFRTNLQSAYMAGREKAMMENTDSRPYWQYVAVMDRRTRPAHAAMNGKVFRHDDPFFDRVGTPPYDYQCRCRLRGLSKGNLEKRGLEVEDSSGRISEEDVLLSKKTGETARVAAYRTADPATGKTVSFRPGAGFDYRKGKAAFQPDLDRYDYAVARKYVEGAVTGPDFTRFFEGKTGGNYPVAVLSEEYRRSIGARTQTVLLSGESLAKNRANHPELGIADYQRLPDVIEKAQLIVQDKENTFVFLKVDSTVYYGAVKTTGTGKALFLTSLRKAEMEDIRRIKRKGRILKDEL